MGGGAKRSPEHDGCHGVDGEEEPDDEGVAMQENAAVLQDGGQRRHRDGQLDEAGDEPGHPVHRVVQTHHLHHLQGDKKTFKPLLHLHHLHALQGDKKTFKPLLHLHHLQGDMKTFKPLLHLLHRHPLQEDVTTTRVNQ